MAEPASLFTTATGAKQEASSLYDLQAVYPPIKQIQGADPRS